MTVVQSARRLLRPVRRLARRWRIRLRELPYRLRRPARGTADWLIATEVKYGGLIGDVPRRKVSRLDARSPDELSFGGMTGGDRMLHHGYAPVYAEHLQRFAGSGRIVLAEFGILTGTGLAIWCDLFPEARILGLDIDLDHFRRNRPALEKRDAFRACSPELHEFDQLAGDGARLGEILNGDRIDVVIDDGLHSRAAVLGTWRAARPHLSDRFVYIIEDYRNLLDECGEEFRGFDCRSYGQISVIREPQSRLVA